MATPQSLFLQCPLGIPSMHAYTLSVSFKLTSGSGIQTIMPSAGLHKYVLKLLVAMGDQYEGWFKNWNEECIDFKLRMVYDKKREESMCKRIG